MSDQHQLAAGGLVPTSTKLGKADQVDTVVARAYRHPVLASRPVIRLVAESVVAGDELEMATLGFGEGENRGAVAKERKRALGFPGWALVNDPKNARYALDVVKEMKKVARRIKHKPGGAKEGFDKIAATLAKSVPHFLPSFYEEIGRAFLEHGALSFAATYFGKAREAESVHALDVDEQHRVDAFLEFALAGAVTTKALSQYAKDLADHHEPADAYAHFRKLCVQRTLGGMPPWAGMAKDLQRLAKAAKLDTAAEDRALVAEIIASPALGKASGELWRAYRDAIVELGTSDPKIRGVLLNLFPTGTSYSAEADNDWLDLVEATGGMDALVGKGDPDAQPLGGRAAWFDKLCGYLARDWREQTIPPRAFDLLERMAPALIADGMPIHCVGRYRRLDLDLCELALELGVQVTVVVDSQKAWMTPVFALDEWVLKADQPQRGRDPARAASHPLLGPLLVKAVGESIGQDGFDRASAGKAGFSAAKRVWLEDHLHSLETGALPHVTETLAKIETKAKPSLFAELPDLHARFAAVDIAPALARSLQIGAIDELGWPELEAVMKELSPEGTTQITIHGGPPALVCATPVKLVAVGPRGRLGEHDLLIPPRHELYTARFIGGRFLVVLKEGGSTAKGYWSTNPHDLFTEPDVFTYNITGLSQRAAVSADGAWLEGAKVIRAGDRTLPTTQDLRAYDGTTTWIVDPSDASRWRELSAAGEKGRASWPRVLEQVLADVGDEWKIETTASWVFPTSFVGGEAVLSGVVALYKTDGSAAGNIAHRMVVMLGGPSWTAKTGYNASSLVQLPGGDPRPVSEWTIYREGIQTTIWNPEFTSRGSVVAWKDRAYSRAQAAPLSPIFWRSYSLRDEEGSRRLRATTTDDAKKLIAAIVVDKNGDIPATQPDEPIAKVLPEISSQQLRNGITGFAIVALKAQQQRDRLLRDRAPGMAVAKERAQPFSDVAINSALETWLERLYNKDGSTWRQISAVGAWFANEDRSNRYVHELKDVPATQVDWFSLVPVRSLLALGALAIGTPADHRRPLAATFAHLARWFPQGAKLRVYGLDGAHGFPGGSHNGVDVRWHGGNAYAVRKRNYSELYRVLEYAPDGQFKPPPAGKVYDEIRASDDALPIEALGALEAAIAAGKTSWSEDAAARLATATGLSSSAAIYLWAGMPNVHDRAASFLDKELREKLDLKAAQAALGRDSIRVIRDYKRNLALEDAARTGVAAILDGRAADALAMAWNRHVGKRVAVPESLIAEADDALSVTGQAAHWLGVFASPGEAPELQLDPIIAFSKSGDLISVASPQPLVGQDKIDAPAAFGATVLAAAVQYLPFLYAELPVGDELRASAARAHERVLERLASPALWLHGGVHYPSTEDQDVFARMLDGLGGTPLANLADGVRGVLVPGAAVFLSKGRAELRLQPSAIDAKAMPPIDKLVAAMNTYRNATYSQIKYARSPGLASMMARIRDTPLPKGAWEQNPALSVPKLVGNVAKRLGVSADAAVLYLQYLVLLWPTPKQLAIYNGWKPKQLADAHAQLVAKDLLVEAKRERARRTHFLPGGWEALKSPHPPMESWKVALYGVRDAQGHPHPPNERFLALAPFHAMFEAAWERIESDDTPRYDEVKR